MRKVCEKWFQRSSPKNKRTRESLASKQITLLEHPPYSLDLAPSDFFFLFPKIKKMLKGRHFDDTDDRSNMAAVLKAIPQNQFKNCFEGWTRR
jgi:transposase